MARRRAKQPKIKQPKRTERVTILLSIEECRMVNHYVRRYKHSSRSSLLRKIVLSHILTELNANYPTLFDQDISQNE